MQIYQIYIIYHFLGLSEVAKNIYNILRSNPKLNDELVCKKPPCGVEPINPPILFGRAYP